LVNIAMSSKMKANPVSVQIWNPLATYKIGGPVWPNISNMPKAGPGRPAVHVCVSES